MVVKTSDGTQHTIKWTAKTTVSVRLIGSPPK